MKEVWEKANPAWLLWVAMRPSVLTDKELRLFAVFCARQVQHLMTDPRSVEAINVAEKYAQGKASDDELAAASAAAYAAARAAADAARAARAANAANASYAATDATAYAARTAAKEAARTAAYAASDAAEGAAAYAAYATIKESQATWLRENTTPNFL